MRKWTRWQDWVALAAGLYALLSPIWTQTTTRATWSLIGLGAVLAVTALWSLAAPGAVASEWIHAILGVLLIIAPFVLGFSGLMGMAITAWATGGVALIVGALGIPASNRVHHDQMVAHS
ncbi:hypothetical protein GCM10009841_14500 [Microlunatus panaciterrae]|uniref:Uncharacterized membrane protein HdeD (DUF308 family) n=1 Tax=Microlunatus panaciterrae TaxID=400768 RepID=A0ABS2RLX5_9ACTN|nr:SPW repeat protein [Microlunatus panaciterrae]MBM7800010.1 uncharacterized membrane protein HdeD (DUF308 family) [Microlunatus panaciterrae]